MGHDKYHGGNQTMGKGESSLRSAWFFLMVRSVGESGMGKGGREKITQE